MNRHYLSPYQIHERWGFHVESIRRIIRSGKLPAVRIGKRLRVAVSDLEAYETGSRVAGSTSSMAESSGRMARRGFANHISSSKGVDRNGAARSTAAIEQSRLSAHATD